MIWSGSAGRVTPTQPVYESVDKAASSQESFHSTAPSESDSNVAKEPSLLVVPGLGCAPQGRGTKQLSCFPFSVALKVPWAPEVLKILEDSRESQSPKGLGFFSFLVFSF